MIRTGTFIGLLFIYAVSPAQDHSRIEQLIWDSKYSEALTVINHDLSSIEAESDKFNLFLRKADVFVRLGQLDSADYILGKLQRNKTNERQLAEIRQALGSVYLAKGRNDLAEENLLGAMEGWNKTDNTNTLAAAQTQALLGNLYTATGRYNQAEEQLSVALITRQKLLPQQHELIAASLNDLGLLYSFLDGNKALDFYERALGIYEKVHGTDHPKLAIVNTNIGYQYLKLELFGDAITNFESALRIWDRVYRDPHASKGFVLFSLGQAYQAMKDLKTARAYYDKSLSVYKQAHGEKHPDVARVYNALGNLEQAGNNFATALKYYQDAMRSNHATFTVSETHVNPSSHDFYNGNVMLFSLLYKAQTLELQYFRKTLRFKDLENALQTLHSCDTIIDRLRQQTRDESDKIALGAIANEVYADGVRIAVSAANVAWQKKHFLEQAFFFAEKSKAAVLLGAISEASAKSFAGIPASTLEEEKQLKSAIAVISQKLAEKPGENEENALRQKLYDLNLYYERFSQKLEKEFPAYFNLKYNSAAPAIPQLIKRLDASSMLISYFTDDKQNRLYIFKVTTKGLTVEDAALPERFDRLTIGLRNSLLFSDISTFRKAVTPLSDVLIPRIPKRIKSLIIIPSSKLGTLPFETLVTHPIDEQTSFDQMPYLLKDYSVRYEFSSGLILQKQQRNASNVKSILLCAPVTFPAASGFPELPGTESEVKSISDLFASKNLHAHLLLRNAADETRIKLEDLKKYALLHFATHGVVDEMSPELSRIHLYKSSGPEDGALYAGEIYNLQLNAELVTLSACQTGLGKITKGEGVIGLSRALVYAGARNCLVTFWKVADESTAILMKDYYRLLLEDNFSGYSKTLREAKLSLMKRKEYSSPYYWAPFILIGF